MLICSFLTSAKGLKKTFGENNKVNAIQFSPIINKRLSAILFHFIQSMGCIQTIPTINNVDVPMCGSQVQIYDTYKSRKEAEGSGS